MSQPRLILAVLTMLLPAPWAALRAGDQPAARRRAYELRRHAGRPSIEGGQPSYDQAAALFAVRGAQPEFWETVTGGRVRVGPDGVTSWQPEAAARHAYVKIQGEPQRLADAIETLMIAPPLRSEHRQENEP